MPRKRVHKTSALVDKARLAGRLQWYNKLLSDGNLGAAEQYAAKHLLLPPGGAGVSQSNGVAISDQSTPQENFLPKGPSLKIPGDLPEVIYAPFQSSGPVSITVGQAEEMINFCATHGREATHSNPDGSPCCNPALGGIMVSCRVWPAPARLMPLLSRRDAEGKPVPAVWGPGHKPAEDVELTAEINGIFDKLYAIKGKGAVPVGAPAGHFYTAEQAVPLPPEPALPTPEAEFAEFKAGDAPLTAALSHSTTAADFASWVDADPTSHQTVTFTPSEPLQEFRPALEPLPQGVRWATVIREPHNQRMKLVRFADGGQEGIAWVGMRDVARAGGRMEGSMLRVTPNPDTLQGGWVIWRG